MSIATRASCETNRWEFMRLQMNEWINKDGNSLGKWVATVWVATESVRICNHRKVRRNHPNHCRVARPPSNTIRSFFASPTDIPQIQIPELCTNLDFSIWFGCFSSKNCLRPMIFGGFVAKFYWCDFVWLWLCRANVWVWIRYGRARVPIDVVG